MEILKLQIKPIFCKISTLYDHDCSVYELINYQSKFFGVSLMSPYMKHYNNIKITFYGPLYPV